MTMDVLKSEHDVPEALHWPVPKAEPEKNEGTRLRLVVIGPSCPSSSKTRASYFENRHQGV